MLAKVSKLLYQVLQRAASRKRRKRISAESLDKGRAASAASLEEIATQSDVDQNSTRP